MSFLLVNVYGPNVDDPEFVFKLGQVLLEMENQTGLCSKIVGGDFNISPDFNRDTTAKVDSHPKARKKLEELIEAFELEDIWLTQFKSGIKYTWKRTSPELVESRLDLFSGYHRPVQQYYRSYYKTSNLKPIIWQ